MFDRLVATAGRRKGPLTSYSVMHTSDLDEARQRISEIFCPHDLSIAQRNDRLDACMCHAPVGSVSFNRLRYGATVAIDPGCLGSFLLVMMPLAGTSDIRCGDDSVHSTPDLASVISPTRPLRMKSNVDCDQIMIRIDRSLLERHCTQHLGHDLRRPIEFDLGMDMRAAETEGWRNLIAYLVAELDRDTKNFLSPLVLAHVQQLVVATLLLAQRHNYRDELLRPQAPPAPHYIRRIEEYIHAHVDEPITVADLSAYAGLSTSALFSGFRRYRNTSPMAYLKSVRLEKVQEELRCAQAVGDTVTDIAMRWGFVHLGHFSADYKRKFGESPSATLNRGDCLSR